MGYERDIRNFLPKVFPAHSSEGSVAIRAGRAKGHSEHGPLTRSVKGSKAENRAEKSSLGVFSHPCENCHKPERATKSKKTAKNFSLVNNT